MHGSVTSENEWRAAPPFVGGEIGREGASRDPSTGDRGSLVVLEV
jgi:hypothetical protein